MSGLLSEIQADDEHNRPFCKVAKILRQMESKDRTDLEAALVSKYSSSAITRVLNRRGFDLSLSVLSRHRRNECVCGTS